VIRYDEPTIILPYYRHHLYFDRLTSPAWRVVIVGLAVPDWVSWVTFIVAGYLGFEGIRLARSGWLLP
jgi:hypothetical protein